MNGQISFLSFLILLFLTSSPINNIQASAVPVSISSSSKIQKHKQKVKNKRNHAQKKQKRLKKRLKQFKTHQNNQKPSFASTLLIVLAAAWYPIFIGLLITAIVLGLTPLLIVSILFLALPIAIALIFGIVFLIILLTDDFTLC